MNKTAVSNKTARRRLEWTEEADPLSWELTWWDEVFDALDMVGSFKFLPNNDEKIGR